MVPSQLRAILHNIAMVLSSSFAEQHYAFAQSHFACAHTHFGQMEMVRKWKCKKNKTRRYISFSAWINKMLLVESDGCAPTDSDTMFPFVRYEFCVCASCWFLCGRTSERTNGAMKCTLFGPSVYAECIRLEYFVGWCPMLKKNVCGIIHRKADAWCALHVDFLVVLFFLLRSMDEEYVVVKRLAGIATWPNIDEAHDTNKQILSFSVFKWFRAWAFMGFKRMHTYHLQPTIALYKYMNTNFANISLFRPFIIWYEAMSRGGGTPHQHVCSTFVCPVRDECAAGCAHTLWHVKCK